MDLTAFALSCTLKPSPAESSTDLLLSQILDALGEHGVRGEQARVADFTVKLGVESDMGDGDEWPQLRRRILDADIFVLGTPIWLGNPSSLCRLVLERMDAMLAETDAKGRMITYDRVGLAAVVGNEDGAHNASAQIYQGLSDVGFTIPAGGVSYWVGRAMEGTDYKDLDETPEQVVDTTTQAASNAAHLARLLKAQSYPA